MLVSRDRLQIDQTRPVSIVVVRIITHPEAAGRPAEVLVQALSRRASKDCLGRSPARWSWSWCMNWANIR